MRASMGPAGQRPIWPQALAAGCSLLSVAAYSEFPRCCKRWLAVQAGDGQGEPHAMILPITLTIAGAAALMLASEIAACAPNGSGPSRLAERSAAGADRTGRHWCSR